MNKYSQFESKLNYIRRKIYILLDKLRINKSFIFEKKNLDNNFFYSKPVINLSSFKDLYIEGYFECEKYFIDYRSDILKEFSFKNKINFNKKYYNDIINSNSVSLAFRSDRFTERYSDDFSIDKINKTKNFDDKQFEFIINSINFFKQKISNPRFFLFSDNFDNLESKFVNIPNIIFVKNFLSNKVLEDFFLMSVCKNYAVAPTSFHWWSAWLNNNPDKICLRPRNINPSNNIDFWPDNWIKI